MMAAIQKESPEKERIMCVYSCLPLSEELHRLLRVVWSGIRDFPEYNVSIPQGGAEVKYQKGKF